MVQHLKSAAHEIWSSQLHKSMTCTQRRGSSAILCIFHCVVFQELYCLSFAPFKRNPEEDEGRDAFEIVLDRKCVSALQ